MRSFVVLLVAIGPLFAQFDDVPIKIPRLRNGRPNLAARTPRKDGKPDLSGSWIYVWPGERNGQDPNQDQLPSRNLAAGIPPEDVVMLPAAKALYEQRLATFGKDVPSSRCLPFGPPRTYTVPAPTKIVQTPDLIVMLHESGNSFREIFLDGRKLPADPVPSWMGYSIGRWDRDTLVVESSGFNDQTWLDLHGHPHTERLRLTERIRRFDTGHLEIQITIDDPGAYAKPWTATVPLELMVGLPLIEHICLENEKDAPHLVGK